MTELANKTNAGKLKYSLLPAEFVEYQHPTQKSLWLLARMAHAEDETAYTYNLNIILSDSPVHDAGVARAMEFGCNKYGRNNWKKGFVWSEMIDAAMRHYKKFGDKDLESGLDHKDHFSFCMAMLVYMLKSNTGVNDIYGKEHEVSNS